MSAARRLRTLVFYALTSALPQCLCFVSISMASNVLPDLADVRAPVLAESVPRVSSRAPSRRSRSPSPRAHEDDAIDLSLRRRVLLAAPALLLRRDAADAAETAAEAIRLLSSKTLPGLGPPDVYYPAFFTGKWTATRLISASDDGFWSDLKEDGGVTLPVKVVSEMRFLPYNAGKDFRAGDPHDVPAVADRGFNERSYYAALSEEVGRLCPTRRPPPAIRSATWTPADPNVLSLAYGDGSAREVRVTERSSDVNADGGGVFSTEFRQIMEVPASAGAAGGVPRVYASRVLAKWKRIGDRANAGEVLVEGLEIAYNEVGTFGETQPLGGAGGTGAFSGVFGRETNDLSDWRSTKTKILLEKIN